MDAAACWFANSAWVSMEREGQQIARGLRRRDPELLDGLIERFQYRLFRYLLSLTGSRESAEDLFQETWTLLVIFIPNAIGFILYFLLRQPIMIKCPQCGETTIPSFNYRPKCIFNLRPTCPNCRHAISSGDKFCSYCACELEAHTQA